MRYPNLLEILTESAIRLLFPGADIEEGRGRLAPASIEVSAEGHTAWFPLRRGGSCVLLDVRVAGRGPFLLLLDTGASRTGITGRRALELDLRIGHRHAIGGFGAGRPDAFIARNLDVELCGVLLRGVDVAVVPQRVGRERRLDFPYDGTVGLDLLRRFVVEIDWPGERVRLHDRRSFVDSETAQPMALSRCGEQVCVVAELERPDGTRISGRFLVDTGADTSMIVFRPFAAVHGLSPAPEAPRVHGYGMGGPESYDVLRFGALHVGGYRFSEPAILLSRTTRGVSGSTDMAGVIGASLLERFRMTLDVPSLRMTLEVPEQQGRPLEEPGIAAQDKSGLDDR